MHRLPSHAATAASSSRRCRRWQQQQQRRVWSQGRPMGARGGAGSRETPPCTPRSPPQLCVLPFPPPAPRRPRRPKNTPARRKPMNGVCPLGAFEPFPIQKTLPMRVLALCALAGALSVWAPGAAAAPAAAAGPVVNTTAGAVQGSAFADYKCVLLLGAVCRTRRRFFAPPHPAPAVPPAPAQVVAEHSVRRAAPWRPALGECKSRSAALSAPSSLTSPSPRPCPSPRSPLPPAHAQDAVDGRATGHDLWPGLPAAVQPAAVGLPVQRRV